MTEEDMHSSEDQRCKEKLAREKRGYFLCNKKCLLVILQLHHKGVRFFGNSLHTFGNRFK